MKFARKQITKKLEKRVSIKHAGRLKVPARVLRDRAEGGRKGKH